MNFQILAKTKSSGGYILVRVPSHPNCSKRGYFMEHRLVMEQHLGRLLLPSEVVHHKNHITDDNRIENLRLCANQKEHFQFHVKPVRYCHCGKRHFAKGLCQRHYDLKAQDAKKVPCGGGCGKMLFKSNYTSKSGTHLCRKCRWPDKKCRKCDRRAAAMGLCKNHYSEKLQEVPCSKCGKTIRSSGRNHFPPVCWKCCFPIRKCSICGSTKKVWNTSYNGATRLLCENHSKQWKRGTLP